MAPPLACPGIAYAICVRVAQRYNLFITSIFRAFCRPARNFFRGYFGAGANGWLSRGSGCPPLPVQSPITVSKAGAFDSLSANIRFIALGGVAAVMGGLEVIPILSRCSRRSISKLPPLADRFYLVDNKAQGKLRGGRLVIAYGAKPSSANAAGRVHSLEPRAVLSSQTSVGCSRITRHGLATSIRANAKSRSQQTTRTFCVEFTGSGFQSTGL